MLSSRAGTSSSTPPNSLGSRLYLKTTTRCMGVQVAHPCTYSFRPLASILRAGGLGGGMTSAELVALSIS